LRKIFRFIKTYKVFSLVVFGLAAGLIVYFSGLHTISHWILATIIIIAVLPLMWDMITTFRSGKYGIDLLAIIAIITSVVLGQYWAGIVVTLTLASSDILEDFAKNRAKQELTSLLKLRPTMAHLIKGKETVDVKIESVKVNDKLSILPGEIIPMDCELIEGETSVNEVNITGETTPEAKFVGDLLLGGSVNLDMPIKVKVVHTAEKSQYEQIIKMIKSATTSEAPFVRLADRYIIPFTAVSLFLASGVWYISGQAIRFLEVIVVATPCPLLLAAPVALVSGVSLASRRGIIIKNGGVLERLAAVKTVAFDKTGTLTLGKPIVSEVETYNSFKISDVLKYASALEQNSNHVLAMAVVGYTKSKKIKFQTAKQVKEVAGHGLQGRLQGRDLLIGHFKLMKDQNVLLPKNFKPTSAKGTTSYVSVGGKLAGMISFSDEIRPEAQTMLMRLKKLKIKNFLIVTGDSLAASRYVGDKLGIKDLRAESLLSDKMTAVESAEYQPVAFVGDGVNDAPVLTIADVGIALGARGSTAAAEAADVVIMQDNVGKVASSLEIARHSFFLAKQSILIGILVSIALMFIFATGRFKPIYGAILQEVVDVFVILNALRAHSSRQRVVDFKKKENKLKPAKHH